MEEDFKCPINNSNKSAGRFFVDILSVAILFMGTGFVLGLLLAPSSGLKTREKIMNKLKDILDRSKFAFEEAAVMGEELIEKSKEKVGEASSKIRSKVVDKKADDEQQ